jgi:extracellular solute-binding protein
MFNGLADSVAKQSDNIENAAAWVTWLGSAEAQDIVASYGVVFPAVASSTDKAVKVLEETGLSTSAFTGHVERRSTFFFPLSFFGADITAIMTPAMEDVYSNRVPASALSRANEQINLLFETSTRE